MTYRFSHIALAALTTFGTCTAMAQVTAVAAMDGDLQSSRVAVSVRGLPTGAEGYKLWFAVLHNSQLYFHGEAGFVTFQCPGFCDAPAHQSAVADPQLVAVRNLDARGLIGAKVYVGWGRSFAEIVDSGQIREVLTVAAPSTDAASLAYSGIYNCQSEGGVGMMQIYPASSFPDWSAKVNVSSTEATIDVSPAETASGFNFQARWFPAAPKVPSLTLLGGGPGAFADSVLYSVSDGKWSMSAYFLPPRWP